MSIYVTADVAKINIRQLLNNNADSYNSTIERLASGIKYNSTSDDPIGSSQATKISFQISANYVVKSNVSTGQNMLSIAGATEDEVLNSLAQVRDLCMQALNGTYSSNDKNAILEDIRSELSNIDSLADDTKYNGSTLLNGSSKNLKIQIGTSSSQTMTLSDAFINVHCSQIGGDIRIPVTVTGENWTDINKYLDKIDLAIKGVTSSSTSIGGYQNRLENTLADLQNSSNNLTQGRSVISDTDVAEESANLVKYQILEQASASVLVQANQSSSMVLSLLNV